MALASPESPPVSADASADSPRSGFQLAALAICALLAGTWTWWALEFGAYFAVVWLPGGALLCVAAILLLRWAPWNVRVRPPAPLGLAVVGLVGLGCWAALSAIWSPAPASAIADAQQILIYAVVFVLGAWLTGLAGSRANLPLLPLALAGAVAGTVCAIGLLTGDDPRGYIDGDKTLDYPIGYRNANAAFVLIAIFPAVGLAADRSLHWPLRGVALGVATLCLDLALLSQSRGSVGAAVAACAVFLLAMPLRLRALVWLLLPAICALGVIPSLTDLFQVDGPLTNAVDEMHAAGVAVAGTTAIAIAIGAVAAWIDDRRTARMSAARTNRVVAVGLAAFIAVSAIGFVIAVGNPIEWIGQRAEEFQTGGSPSVRGESSRFALDFGTERDQLWDVALEQFSDSPAYGDGAGGFQYTYLRERSPEGVPVARDAHSIELEVLGELGLVGVILLALALGAAVVAALRARRAGSAWASLSAVALASGTYWLAHSSLDWFFHYPALTAPALALLGSACVAGARRAPLGADRRRIPILVAVAILAVTLIPPFLSERYVNDAYAEWRDDLERAYDDADRAASLNQLSDSPLLAEGAIAQAAGDRQRAIEALTEAAERVPEEWATHYLLAGLYATDDPELARQELEIARELNPLSEDVARLDRTLSHAETDAKRHGP
jgi:hypothetical protein